MKSAVVTGAAGFIGSAVCRWLIKNNVNVYAIVRNKEANCTLPDSPLIHIVEMEMNTYAKNLDCLMNNVDVFYHFAWDSSYGVNLSNYEIQIMNIMYTSDAIALAKRINCKKFIFAGTINEYELVKYMNGELNKPRSTHIYAISKLASDFICKTLATEYQLNYNTAIIGSVFGPGDKSKRIHNAFIKSMLCGKSPALIAGNSLYDWVYIDDAAMMLYEIGKKSVNEKNYYIGHNQLKYFKDILLEVRDILNPSMDITFGARKDDIFIDYSYIDINSVYQDTGCKLNSDFRECIMKTAEWVNTLDF